MRATTIKSLREERHVATRTGFQHARRSRRRQARSGDRRARHADLPDDVLRLRRRRPRRLAVRPEGLRQHLHPHHEPDAGRARGARRRARGRHGGARDRLRPRRAAPGLPHSDAAGRQFRRRRRLYGGSINQFGHAFKNFGWNVRWADTHDLSTFESADRRQDPRRSSSRASPIRAASSSTSRRSPRSPTSTACRSSSTTRWPRPTSCGRSSTAPTSSSIR